MHFELETLRHGTRYPGIRSAINIVTIAWVLGATGAAIREVMPHQEQIPELQGTPLVMFVGVCFITLVIVTASALAFSGLAHAILDIADVAVSRQRGPFSAFECNQNSPQKPPAS